jgi:translocation and assembly module TamB
VQVDLGGYSIQNDGLVTVSSKEGAFKFENARFKGENTALELNGGVTLFKEWDLFVNGEADLNLFKVFTKEISSGKGKALLDLRISDRWEQPQVRGALTLQDGTVRTTTLSQTVHLMSVALLFNERQLVLETFEGEMGRGRFHGTGKADLAGFGVGGFSFLLTMEEARVHLLPDLSATVDGELLFRRNGKSQTLQGELTLKKATYSKRVDLRSLVANSGKVKEASFSEETPMIGKTTMNIHLYGKEEIWINNNIAKIPLDLDLFLKGTVDDPLLIGRINLPEGHVHFRGNDFVIVSSSMDFLNPDKIDPTFDIKAKTEVKNFSSNISYAIDLNLTGTLLRFTLTLTSFPSLPEADILSLLTLGKTTAEIAQTQKGGGGNEATSFVVSELLDLEPVQKLTGIDRIQVEPYTNGTKSSSGNRLTAEKSLMDGRLLMIYSKTLDPSEEDVIRMIYEVSKNVSLVGKRDEKGQIGGDLRFRFEFR